MTRAVLFIHGGGAGAYDADRILAASLQKALGRDYNVRCPRMPNEESPDLHVWKSRVAEELVSLGDDVVLVGHSLGGLLLLRLLSEEPVAQRIDGVYVIAAPSWDDKEWNYDDLKLPRDVAARLSKVRRIVLYHSRDDEVVPFAHLALHAARLPWAIVREADKRGHQFGNDLSDVAADIARR